MRSQSRTIALDSSLPHAMRHIAALVRWDQEHGFDEVASLLGLQLRLWTQMKLYELECARALFVQTGNRTYRYTPHGLAILARCDSDEVTVRLLRPPKTLDKALV